MLKMVVTLSVVLSLVQCDTTTTDSLYHCFLTHNCFLINSCFNPELNLSDTEINRCTSAKASRDLCLLQNGCNFKGEDQYSYDCWHCWAGVDTKSTVYQSLVKCIEPCYKEAGRVLMIALLAAITLLFV